MRFEFSTFNVPCPASVVVRNGTTDTAPVLWSLCGQHDAYFQTPAVVVAALHVSVPFVTPSLVFSGRIIIAQSPVEGGGVDTNAASPPLPPLLCDFTPVSSDGSVFPAGTFSAKSRSIIGSTTSARAAAFADVNGNGVVDWVGLVHWHVSSVDMLVWVANERGVDAGAFSASYNVIYGFAQSLGSGIVAADVNGDSAVDVVALHVGSGNIVAFENGGEYPDGFRFSGEFQTLVEGSADTQTSMFVMADVNNDGLVDCISSSDNTGLVYVATNVERGSMIMMGHWPTTAVTASPLSGAVVALVAVQLDDDALVDIVVATADSVLWLRNTGAASTPLFDGSVGVLVVAGLSGALPGLAITAVAVSDFDFDGETDVVYSDAGSGNIVLVSAPLGNRSGSSASVARATPVVRVTVLASRHGDTGTGEAIQLQPVDVNDDGQTDVVVTTPYGVEWIDLSQMAVLASGARHGVLATRVIAGPVEVGVDVGWRLSPGSVAFGDVDGDGDKGT